MLSFGFRRLKVCEAFGIPVYLDWSTIILALMFLQLDNIVLSLALAAVLLVSIVLHELGHSLTARCFGCNTRDITLTVIGGCASLERMPYKAWQELLVAAAGPATSFVIGAAMWFAAVALNEGFAAVLLWCGAQLNIGLALFNLLPGFPMDGGRIFRSLARFFTTRARATYVAMAVGRVFAVLLVVGPLLGVTHVWIIPIGGSFVLRALIAWMIWTAGWNEYQLALAEENYRRWTQADFDARVSPPPYDL